METTELDVIPENKEKRKKKQANKQKERTVILWKCVEVTGIFPEVLYLTSVINQLLKVSFIFCVLLMGIMALIIFQPLIYCHNDSEV